MRTRVVVAWTDKCGCCGHEIKAGSEAVRVTLPTATLLRCVTCAGPVAEGSPLRLVSGKAYVATRVSELAAKFARTSRDWKHEQAGER